MTHAHHRGFVALMSVIIISAILLVLVFTLGVSSFFNRFNVLDAENKRVSLGLAEACVSVAMLKVAKDASYTVGAPGECVSVGDASGVAAAKRVCKVCNVTAGASFPKTIETRAVYNGAYTNLRVTITNSIPGNFAITAWSELANGPAGCAVP